MKDVISQTVFLCVFLCLARAAAAAAAGRSGTLAFDGGLNALWIINPEWHSLECSPAVPFDGQRGRGGRSADYSDDGRSSYFQCFSIDFSQAPLAAARCTLSPASLFCQLGVSGKSRDKYHLSFHGLKRMVRERLWYSHPVLLSFNRS